MQSINGVIQPLADSIITQMIELRALFWMSLYLTQQKSFRMISNWMSLNQKKNHRLVDHFRKGENIEAF